MKHQSLLIKNVQIAIDNQSRIEQSILEWNKSNFLKVAFHKFYLVYSWILCLK